MGRSFDDPEDLEELGPGTVNTERVRRMKRLMRQLYREEFETKRFRLPPIKARGLIVFLSFASMVVMGVTTLYNFNLFVTLDERILAANGRLEDALHRRTSLFNNLVNLTLNQSALEQEVFRHVADVRTQIGKAAPGSPPTGTTAPTAVLEKTPTTAPEAPTATQAVTEKIPAVTEKIPAVTEKTKNGGMLPDISSLSNLLAVAEQYPQIRATETYQLLMNTLVELENRITQRRDEYNEEVRVFNTLITSFPWYILAKITGFKRYHYFSIEGDMNAAGHQGPNVVPRIFERLLPLAPQPPKEPKRATGEKVLVPKPALPGEKK